MKIPKLKCRVEEMIVLSISDAAYGAMPRGASQGGLIVAFAEPEIQQGEAGIALMEAQSSKLQRVVRCSMAAELTMSASAFEHGDYVRAVLAEITMRDFRLAAWKLYASRWKHILVLDAKVAYDAIASEVAPTDRKLIVDIAILKEALEDPESNSFIRWVPGHEIPGDGLTKWHHNGALNRVISGSRWSLCDTALAADLRRKVAQRKRALKANTTGGLC